MITVAQLRKALEGADDSLPVLLTGGGDHSYLTCSTAEVATVARAEGLRRHHEPRFAEWYDEHNASPGEKPVQALVIGG